MEQMRTAQPHPHPNLPPEGEGTQFLPLQGGGKEGDGVDVELRLTVLLEFLSPLPQTMCGITQTVSYLRHIVRSLKK